MNEPRPFPSPLQAALLTLLASFLASLAALAASSVLTPTAALGVGSVLGIGAAGALGAAHVPPPHAERLGLRGLRLGQLLPLLLLVAVALLASELDNVAKAWMPPPDAPQVAQNVLEKLPTRPGLGLVETVVVAVGLVPVIEEWFFRGVLQQGLVATLGTRGGVFLTALLFALGHGAPGLSPASWLAVGAQSLVLGLVFGFARQASGSLLGAIVVHAGVNAAGVAALAGARVVAIPGYNAPGAHTPPALLAAALVSVVLGGWWLSRMSQAPLPAPPPARDEPEDDGPDLP